MILIVTNRSDHTADWLILELQRRRSEYVRFNTEDYPGDVRLAWTPSGGQLLKLRDREIDLGQVGAVWYRRPMPPAAGLWSSPQRARWAMGESREALRGVWRTLDALWVNHPDHNRLAGPSVARDATVRDAASGGANELQPSCVGRERAEDEVRLLQELLRQRHQPFTAPRASPATR